MLLEKWTTHFKKLNNTRWDSTPLEGINELCFQSTPHFPQTIKQNNIWWYSTQIVVDNYKNEARVMYIPVNFLVDTLCTTDMYLNKGTFEMFELNKIISWDSELKEYYVLINGIQCIVYKNPFVGYANVIGLPLLERMNMNFKNGTLSFEHIWQITSQ